jgi:hypothetical protein
MLQAAPPAMLEGEEIPEGATMVEGVEIQVGATMPEGEIP